MGSQFLQGNAVGNGVKGSIKAQKNNIPSFSLIHSGGHPVIEGVKIVNRPCLS